MPYDLTPASFWRLPVTRSPLFWDDEDDSLNSAGSGNLTVWEDETHVCVEAALPGIDPKDIDVTYDRGVVWIKGEVKETEAKRKYYRKATTAFSYRITIPGDLDQRKEPEAGYKNGIMTVSFAKLPTSQPKKITVKA